MVTVKITFRAPISKIKTSY